MIDLHTHSTFSDGSLTPVELADLAVKEKLTAIALTDHDTTAGISVFLAACKERKLIGIAGVEISADVDNGTMHMLGYHVDPGNAVLSQVLAKIRSGRDDRNSLIIEKLNRIGKNITMADVLKHVTEEVVGRPHFAEAMMDKGYVSSVKEAFDFYLGKGKAAYVDRFRFTPEIGIESIKTAGGVAVLAHPATLGLKDKALREFVGTLAEAGLGGIEVYYSEHSSDQVIFYSALAREFKLVKTGGSDFHGKTTPDMRLGRGFGPLRVEDELLEPLEAAAGRR
ncbi:MAG: PHP domain-containing protein [bacterium]